MAWVPSLLSMTLGRADITDEGKVVVKSVSGLLRCQLGWVWEWAWSPLAWTPKCHASRVGV